MSNKLVIKSDSVKKKKQDQSLFLWKGFTCLTAKSSY